MHANHVTAFPPLDDASDSMELIVDGLNVHLACLVQDGWKPPLDHMRLAWQGRPLWWWRVKLVEWAHSTEARSCYGANALRGFTSFIDDMNEGELGMFLCSTEQRAPSGERSA